jgi:hypothetical protein
VIDSRGIPASADAPLAGATRRHKITGLPRWHKTVVLE